MASSDHGDDDDQRQPLMADDGDRRHVPSHSRPIAQQVQLANGRRKPLKATEKMWVIATTSLISFLAFSSQLFVLIPYWLDTPGVTWTQMALYLVPFNIGVAAIFYNYYCVVFTNPGSVPEGWEPDWDAIGGVEVKASTGQPRYCKVCRSYKPPRAHHCRTCKRCVLRMDHHCPWVANCVGHGNYGHFLRFLWSVDFTMSIHLTLLCLRVADWWSPMVLWREPSTTDMVLMILNFAQGVPVLLMVGIFSMYHTYALCTNTTTIESWEKDKVATLIRRGKIEEIKYPYDLGMKRNIQSILGRRMLTWCWPGAKPMGNGMDYSPGEGHDWRDQFYWPPRDPTRPGSRRMRKRGEPRFRLPESGPFTYGGDGFNPALVPSNSAARQRADGDGDVNGIPNAPTLRKRGSSNSASPTRGPPPGLHYDDGEGWSKQSPYRARRSGDGDGDDGEGEEEEEISSAEEAGVVDGGCMPPGLRRSKKDATEKRKRTSKRPNSDFEEEEHELLAAREARKWGQTPSNNNETFPRLWAEEDSASEDSDVSTSDVDDEQQPPAAALRSRIRRGSEGYEVRPMMYDRAYAAQVADEEERLREFLMSERERLGTAGAHEYELRYGSGSGYGYGYYAPQEHEYEGEEYEGEEDAWGEETQAQEESEQRHEE